MGGVWQEASHVWPKESERKIRWTPTLPREQADPHIGWCHLGRKEKFFNSLVDLEPKIPSRKINKIITLPGQLLFHKVQAENLSPSPRPDPRLAGPLTGVASLGAHLPLQK